MNVIGIIPVRMASSRFPGKPMAKIAGIPMLGHVYFRSKMCDDLKEVYITTEDQAIYDYAQTISAKCILTKDSHQRATERSSEAVQKIEQEDGQRVDFAVMIQGDEPLIYPTMIASAVRAIVGDSTVDVLNLMSAIRNVDELKNPNTIKVVIDCNNYALYFSRMPIPFMKDGSFVKPLKQVCVIPFRRDFLFKFTTLPPTPLEIAESIDMMRILEHGYKVKMVLSEHETYSVDVPKDLRRVRRLFNSDSISKHYLCNKLTLKIPR